MHIVLFYTPWGLRTRAVGEHPKAADTLGINVFFMRYVNVIVGGMIAGLGGAYFTLGSVGRFDEVMTAGKGFIGLAAMIFGNWNPIGAFLASLIFGFADSLQIKMQILSVPIPSSFLAMAPYIVTMIVLTGVVGTSHHACGGWCSVRKAITILIMAPGREAFRQASRLFIPMDKSKLDTFR